MDREVLAAMVDAGASTREIGRELGLSQATVRHWLGVHGLQTRRAVRNALLRQGRRSGEDELELLCDRHGRARHVRVAGRGLRCALCRSAAVSERRRRVKAILVAEAGGACVLCGYDTFVGALHFHHLDPRSKEFHLAQKGSARSLDRARAEAAKCALLCSNCHAEVEGGVSRLPS